MSARHLKDVRDHRILTPHGQSKENRLARRRYARALKQRGRNMLAKDIADTLAPEIVSSPDSNMQVPETSLTTLTPTCAHIKHATADAFGVRVAYDNGDENEFSYFHNPGWPSVLVSDLPEIDLTDLADTISATDLADTMLAPTDLVGFHSVRITRGGNLRGVKTLPSDIKHSLATAAA